MSPGITFERVYRELKRRLAEGEFRPGMAIEPATLGADLDASVTPIRDALHRLVGERLVQAPQHDGFRVPRPTETELRDLYAWNDCLLAVATRRLIRPAPPAPSGPDHPIRERTASLFQAIAACTANPEHSDAIRQMNDRLAPYRTAEAASLPNLGEEIEEIQARLAGGDRAMLKRALARYHRRRHDAAPHILRIAIRPLPPASA